MLNQKYQTKWNLNDFYNELSDPKLDQDIAKILPMVKSFAKKYKGKIANLKADNFLEFFKDDTAIDEIVNKISLYFLFLSSLDTQNQAVIKKQGEFDNILIEATNLLLFVSQEFKEIGYEKLMEFSITPTLSEYKNFFVHKADSIKYLLDEKTEFALNLKERSGSSTLNNLYEELTNSFVFKVNLGNETTEMTEEEVRSLRMSPNENVRKEAFRSLREVYNTKQVQITLGNIYSGIVKDWTSEVKIRGYDGIMSPRNNSEQIPDKAIDLLLSEVENSYPLYQRYLKVKAKIMGKERLKNWDLLAPLDKNEKEYSFEDGLQIYLDNVQKFDKQFYDYSVELLENGRVDVFPTVGKRGGAYCAYEKDIPSRVLLNYTNKLNDISTIAHEFGHAIHGFFAQKQKSQVYSSGLCLAETASVFNETMLNESLLKQLETKQEKLHFLGNQLQDITSTIFRQINYIAFERKAHEQILSGKELTFEDYNKMWRNEQVKMAGNIVEYDVESDKESSWSSIPHIFRTPFYCYSYAFGNILSFALYEKYRKEGQSFVETYKNILRSGGSKSPYDLLMENGMDITKPEFYKTGLKVVETIVEEFEEMAM